MTLDEIATGLPLTCRSVPDWTLGTVRRRSITFATGVTDERTQVVWVQAHNMTGDIRIHAARPSLAVDRPLDQLDRETRALLASVEGGIAATSWAYGVMTWAEWHGFQPYDKYPEPGLLHRVGDCMIGRAPSGIYVEDWRFQTSAPGVLAGLRLLAEVDADGVATARSGGLVVAGDHAILCVCRRDALPRGTRAQDVVRTSDAPAVALARVFDCTVDYAVRRDTGSDRAFVITLSTDPRREGQVVALTAGFTPTARYEVLRQVVSDVPGVTERLWRVESLEAGCVFGLTTPAPAAQLAWLDREADTLLAPLAAGVRCG